MRQLLAVSLALLCPSAVTAGELVERVPEFFQVEDAFPAKRGELETNARLQVSPKDSDAGSATIASLGFEFGVTERISLGASMPWTQMHDDGTTHRGLGDASAELTYAVLGRERHTAFALALELTAPTRDAGRGLGEGAWETEMRMVFAGAVGGLQMHGNLGAAFSAGETALVFGASAVKDGVIRLMPSIELSGSAGGEMTELYLTPGVHWRLGEETWLSAGMPIALTADPPPWSIVVSISSGL
jgi:hypothetical protein